jgi:deazaflavin-dependent oxidoreductase (nitroreductase family)
MDPSRKAALTHGLDRWLVNPIVRAGVRTGLAPKAFALLETTGRHSGQPRLVPVGNGLDRDEFWIVAQDGRRCAYVLNIEANPRVRVRTPRGPWRKGRAEVIPDVDGVAIRRRIDAANGLSGRLDGIIFRAVRTEMVTIRITLDP